MSDLTPILLVEDDPEIAKHIQAALQEAGFHVHHTDNGIQGRHFALTTPYAAVIVDLMLPGADGLTLIRHMRESGITTPAMIVSAKKSVTDRIQGLETGADDYLPKPFSVSELVARIHALIRRQKNPTGYEPLVLEDLRVDPVTREVVRGECRIELLPKEYALLELLLQHQGKPVSRTAIIHSVWDTNLDPQTNMVDVLVCRLRNKIDKDFPVKLLHTRRGVGYVLKPDPS